jgi:hypothetical protein
MARAACRRHGDRGSNGRWNGGSFAGKFAGLGVDLCFLPCHPNISNILFTVVFFSI